MPPFRFDMYPLFLTEWVPMVDPPSFFYSNRMLNKRNNHTHPQPLPPTSSLSTHTKKDQWSLYAAHGQGNEQVNERLAAKFESHCAEKQKVRELKEVCKEEASANNTVLRASFDLPQVNYQSIYLTKSALFCKKTRISKCYFAIYREQRLRMVDDMDWRTMQTWSVWNFCYCL